MKTPPHNIDQLRRLQQYRTRSTAVGVPLGEELIAFFKQSVAKRQTKLCKIAESWAALVPPMLSDHCSLESLNKGTLAVLVDSSSHLYQLKQLLLAGLQDQLFLACRSTGLRKINLKAGRWYEAGEDQTQRVRFKEN